MFKIHLFIVVLGICQIIVNSQIILEPQIIQSIALSYDKKPFFIILGYKKSESIGLISNLSYLGYQSACWNTLMDDFPSLDPLQNGVILFNLNSNSSTELLENANNNNLFDSPLKWIIINNNYNLNLTDTVQIFAKYNILVDSDVILVNKLYEENYLLVKIYKYSKNDKDIVIEQFGIWSKESKLKITEQTKITAVRRKNLMGTILRTSIVITHNDTLIHLTDYREKHIDSITKVNYILVRHLADTVNASLTYSVKNTWGYQINSSKWTGMLGELTEDRADIGGTPLFVTTDRVTIIDYIAMTTPTRSNFVFRQPKLSYVTNVFTLPFHWSVWLSSVALVVITTIGLFIMLKWEAFTRKSDPTWDLQPKDAVIMSIGAVCQQGASSVPDMSSGRITTLFIFVSLMFLYTSYSANIVALLQSSSNSIQSLEDLLKSRLSVGVDDTVFNRFYFPAATEPIRKALYEQKVAPKNQKPRFLPIEEGVKRLRQGLFAFHMEGGSGYKLVGETFYEDEKCDLQEISFLQVPDPWLAIQKNSSYKELLKIGLRKIQESGLQSREVSRIYTKKPQCHGTTSSFVSVGLIDIYSAVLVFISGVSTAVLVFLVELIVHKYICRK